MVGHHQHSSRAVECWGQAECEGWNFVQAATGSDGTVDLSGEVAGWLNPSGC